MVTDLKQNETRLVCGGKKLIEHVCGTLKEVIKGSGLAYCIALPADDNMFGRIGRMNEPRKRALCSAIVIGTAEVMYHLTESVFGFGVPTNTTKTP